MIRRRAALLTALVCAALVMSGCGGAPAPAETTPLFASEEEAFAAAEATYRAYVDALNGVDLSDPETFEPVFELTTGELNASDRKGLTNYHASGYVVSGESRVSLIKPASYNEGTVELSVCLDVSDVLLLDSEGRSLVDPDRVDVQSLTVSLESAKSSPSGLLFKIAPRDDGPTC